ncbi:hypothetical protein PC114_g18445 [Phytophthora cactorum]|nr:hypothetical protein PC114_g18445 [Phytophthora cactorum]KAG3167426.1 hypothetical protein PC128_g19484 [Phytophthora cactorum]
MAVGQQYLHENPGASASAIVTLAREGNLELMKRVARPHSKNRMSEKRATKWEWRMSAACKRGDLLMVKWMAEHPIGQELRRCPTGLLRIAAQNGHLPPVVDIWSVSSGCSSTHRLAVKATRLPLP